MSNYHSKVLAATKALVRSAIDRAVRIWPNISGRLALRILANTAVVKCLPAAGIAQLRRALDESDEAGYRQECFAQEGEDLVIMRLLGEREHGFYVDVGAHHPARHSNTFLLYRRSWRGINIDATPGSMELFFRMRPRDINVEALVAADGAPRPFHMLSEPALNTAAPELAALRPTENRRYKVAETVTLTPRTLAAILDEYLPNGQSIDLMSVDVEGLDLDVLVSNDWSRYRPELLLVELLGTELEEIERHEIVRFLRSKGYRPIAKLYNTVIFR
jgi:hypothetical protein